MFSRTSLKLSFGIYLAVTLVVIFTRSYFGSFECASSGSYPTKEQPREIQIPVVTVTKRPAKIILQWTKFFGRDTYGSVTSLDTLDCEVSDCIITANRSLLNHSDAIMFHASDAKLNDLPATRNESQHYVFVFFESPGLHGHEKIFNCAPYFFNLTMTYRTDADIPNPYGQVIRRNAPADVDTSLKQTIRGKTKLIAWFVSKCSSVGKRENYVKNLAQHIQVDIYGRCGNLSCPRSNELACNLMLKTDYKFYLAFENSNCRDYVTEKFFRSLKYDVVPIVYGKADYKNVAPPHSYIDIKDFKSTKDLADYLRLLDSNHKLYQRYFDWKKDYYVDLGLKQGWCRLCSKLHDPNASRKSYESILNWYTEPSQCSKPFSPVP